MNQKKSKNKGILIALGIILGFILLLIGSFLFTFRNYNISISESGNFSISLKPSAVDTNNNLEQYSITNQKTHKTIKNLKEKFSIKYNIVSIIILLAATIFYFIIKKRSEDYVKRENE